MALNSVHMTAPAKINLRLVVTSRRGDGYHLLSMVNVRCSLSDELSLTISDRPGFSVSSVVDQNVPWVTLPPDFDAPQNLVVRAAAQFSSLVGWPSGLQIGLKKRIPLGAGLGGGSADAAAVLQGLSGLAKARGIQVDPNALAKLASHLGADLPYALAACGPAYVSGMGEQVSPLGVDGPQSWPAFLIFPPAQVSTAKAFALFAAQDPDLTDRAAKERAQLIEYGIEGSGRFSWARLPDLVRNDLIAVAPDAVKQALSRARAVPGLLVFMTGSGSTVVAVPWPTIDRLADLEASLRAALGLPLSQVTIALS